MIEIRQQQIVIDGTPHNIMSGEVHYFRVPRQEWPDRIRSLKDAGCTALASYIPWLWHELPNGELDVTGRTRPERVAAGGGLLLYGPVPARDLEGRPCTVLADALGVSGGRVLRGSHAYFTSVVGHAWVPAMPETRVGWLQELEVGAADAEPLFTDPATGRTCGVEVAHGAGRAVLFAAELPSRPALFRTAVERLGAAPGLTNDAAIPGLFTTSTVADDSGRLLHLLNVSGYPNPARLWLDGRPLFDGRPLRLPPRTGLMLPLDLRLAAAVVRTSTAELAGSGPGHLAFALTQDEEMVVLETDRRVGSEQPCDIRRDGGLVTVTATRAAVGAGPLVVSLT
jgi:beta-galactosidase